jgi:peptidoglycan/xylan/chitin deacetylase (PgdA/CDA1 family)
MAVSHRKLRPLSLAAIAMYVLLVVLVGGWLGWSLASGMYRSGQPAISQPAYVPSQAAPSLQPSPSATAPAPPPTRAVIPLGRTQIRVPILMYHYIRVVTNPSDVLGFNLSVTPANLAAQMDWLAKNGYHPVTFSDLRAYFEGQALLPAKPVVLTFDDGYLDFYKAAEPILLANGFKAVAYIVPGFWGRAAYMSRDQLVQLDRSGLVEIGSHTVDHVNLVNASAVSLNYELRASKSMLEELLGHPVVDFCYPSGRFNSIVITAVGSAGYMSAVTELPGTALAWPNRLTWPRVRVSGGETLTAFVANLGQPEPTVEQTVVPTPEPSPRPGYFNSSAPTQAASEGELTQMVPR